MHILIPLHGPEISGCRVSLSAWLRPRWWLLFCSVLFPPNSRLSYACTMNEDLSASPEDITCNPSMLHTNLR